MLKSDTQGSAEISMINRTDSILQKLNRVIEEAIQAMADMVEVRDPYTAGHQRRVARLCYDIGRELALPDWRLKGLQQAGVIHDIGKLYIPSELLSKPTLSATEFNLIKSHPRVGYEILKGIEFPWPLAQIVLQHHERMNGSGYPDGILHFDILLEARILAAADVVDAMAIDRPYKPAVGVEGALAELSKNKATLYDSNVVDACIKVIAGKNYDLRELSREDHLVPA
jgi:HD-GYP domain-containing protein (c-di-GMP phosphodiesterase class II)